MAEKFRPATLDYPHCFCVTDDWKLVPDELDLPREKLAACCYCGSRRMVQVPIPVEGHGIFRKAGLAWIDKDGKACVNRYQGVGIAEHEAAKKAA
jgi:hypothetical protein